MVTIHVALCVPSLGTWCSETAVSVALIASFFEKNPVFKGVPQKLTLINVESSHLSASRERMVKKALQSEATHILFIDSDMAPPMDTIHRLMRHQLPYVAANCTTRQKPAKPVAYDINGVRMQSKGKTGLERAQFTGLAVALVETEVVKKLQPPLFLMDWLPFQNEYCGEDVYFTQKLSEAGVTLWVDHDLSVKVGHVGRYTYSHKDVEAEDVDVRGTDVRGEGVECAPVPLPPGHGTDQGSEARPERPAGAAGKGGFRDLIKGPGGEAGLQRKPLCDAVGSAFGQG